MTRIGACRTTLFGRRSGAAGQDKPCESVHAERFPTTGRISRPVFSGIARIAGMRVLVIEDDTNSGPCSRNFWPIRVRGRLADRWRPRPGRAGRPALRDLMLLTWSARHDGLDAASVAPGRQPGSGPDPDGPRRVSKTALGLDAPEPTTTSPSLRTAWPPACKATAGGDRRNR